jgi:hypothetical protein
MQPTWQSWGLVAGGAVLAILTIVVYNAGPSSLIRVAISLALVMAAIYFLLRLRTKGTVTTKAMAQITRGILLAFVIAALIFAAWWILAIRHA